MTQPCMGCTKYKKRKCIISVHFLFYISTCSAYAEFIPQPVIKIFRFDIEQIVMERAYNKVRYMPQKNRPLDIDYD